MKSIVITLALTVACVLSHAPASAHDTWVHIDAPVIRTGDVSHISLMLGNHGNEHRDFKLASKIALEGWTLSVVGPNKAEADLKPKLVDMGYAPNEGFWAGRFTPTEPGLYVVSHQLDKLHRTTRAIKSGKSYLLAGPSLDQLAENRHDFTKPLGHPIEFVPLVDPIRDLAPGKPIQVRLIYAGKPLANARVSFIPRGATLAEDFDEKFERRTDDKGEATFTPDEANWILVVVHHSEPDQKGEGFDKTAYTATLTLQVPGAQRPSTPTTAAKDAAQ